MCTRSNHLSTRNTLRDQNSLVLLFQHARTSTRERDDRFDGHHVDGEEKNCDGGSQCHRNQNTGVQIFIYIVFEVFIYSLSPGSSYGCRRDETFDLIQSLRPVKEKEVETPKKSSSQQNVSQEPSEKLPETEVELRKSVDIAKPEEKKKRISFQLGGGSEIDKHLVSGEIHLVLKYEASQVRNFDENSWFDGIKGEEPGIVHVDVVEARNLAPRDKSGSSDPYVVLNISKKQVRRKLTEISMKTHKQLGKEDKNDQGRVKSSFQRII